jgi:hypothetical protein
MIVILKPKPNKKKVLKQVITSFILRNYDVKQISLDPRLHLFFKIFFNLVYFSRETFIGGITRLSNTDNLQTTQNSPSCAIEVAKEAQVVDSVVHANRNKRQTKAAPERKRRRWRESRRCDKMNNRSQKTAHEPNAYWHNKNVK